MMSYFAKITRQKDGGFLVEFPDLLGCLTEGNSLKDALSNAQEALNGWLAARCDRYLNIPNPSKKKWRNCYPIGIDLQLEFVIRLRKIRKKKGLSQEHVA